MKGAFAEVFRTTFPKKLRFDQASQILYAQCYSLSRRYKNKKYIPLQEVEQILAQYTYVPYRPWLRLPVIRHVLFIRFINSVRHYRGQSSWLYNKGVEEEFDKLTQWCEKQRQEQLQQRGGSNPAARPRGAYRGRNPAGGSGLSSSPSTSTSPCLVGREVFDREVLHTFHVATMYQRIARLLIFVCIALLTFAIVSLHVDTFLYAYTRWKGWRREEVLAWFREVLLLHAVADVPPAYAHLLPFPCVVHENAEGRKELAVSVVELELDSAGITVLAVPAPHIGEKSFFRRLGRIISECDAVVLEGVSFDKIDKMIPASLLPLKENTFPALGVHHRFLDILQSDREPPMLYPGGSNLGWRTFLQQVFTPFEVQCVYRPTWLSASKGEAKVGWGRLRELIDRRVREVEEKTAVDNGTSKASKKGHPAVSPYIICLPWTIQHIVNMEASLVKYGFKVKRVFVLPWIAEDHLGEQFCNFYHINA